MVSKEVLATAIEPLPQHFIGFTRKKHGKKSGQYDPVPTNEASIYMAFNAPDPTASAEALDEFERKAALALKTAAATVMTMLGEEVKLNDAGLVDVAFEEAFGAIETTPVARVAATPQSAPRYQNAKPAQQGGGGGGISAVKEFNNGLTLKSGQYGPFLTDGSKTSAGLKRSSQASTGQLDENLTEDQAWEFWQWALQNPPPKRF